MEAYIGQIMLFAGTYAPKGWAFCEGQLLSISQNTALFSLLGTQFGGDGINTFALPDLRGRVVVGPGNGPGLSPKTQGQQGGVESVTLTANQMPQHTHGVMCDTQSPPPALKNSPAGNLPANLSSGTGYGPGTNATMSQAMIQASGGSQPHENMQPWACIHYIIALTGLYPPRD